MTDKNPGWLRSFEEKFSYLVTINDAFDEIRMIQWCRERYGCNYADSRFDADDKWYFENPDSPWDYAFDWTTHTIVFGFPTAKDAVEFKLRFG